MYIYRIEHGVNGYGPYQASLHSHTDKRQYDMGWKHLDAEHPEMWSDCTRPFNHFYDEYHCGFRSIEQMISWFEGWFDILDTNGFIVAIYDCPMGSVISGTFQSVFNKEDSKRVDTMSISNMLCAA